MDRGKKFEPTEGVLQAQRLAGEERRRVNALIARDRVETIRNAMRDAAEIEVASGKFVNLSDTVVEPTPEWMEKGDVERFTPRAPDGTVRSVTTVRRRLAPVTRRLWAQGRISDDQYAASIRYRDRYEEAGLRGRFKSSHISLTSGFGGGGLGQSPMAMHEFEADARLEFRQARSAVAAHTLKFVDAVVLHDLPLRQASRFVRCRNGQELLILRRALTALVDVFEAVGADLTRSDD